MEPVRWFRYQKRCVADLHFRLSLVHRWMVRLEELVRRSHLMEWCHRIWCHRIHHRVRNHQARSQQMQVYSRQVQVYSRQVQVPNHQAQTRNQAWCLRQLRSRLRYHEELQDCSSDRIAESPEVQVPRRSDQMCNRSVALL